MNLYRIVLGVLILLQVVYNWQYHIAGISMPYDISSSGSYTSSTLLIKQQYCQTLPGVLCKNTVPNETLLVVSRKYSMHSAIYIQSKLNPLTYEKVYL